MYPCPFRSLTKPDRDKMSNDTFIDAGDIKTKQNRGDKNKIK